MVSARAGSALVVVVLGLLIIEAMVLGTLAIAAGGAAAAGLGARRLHARLLAESAVRATLAHWTEHPWDTLAAGAVHVDTSAFDSATVVVEALAGGRFLLRASAPGLGVSRTLVQALAGTLPRDSLRGLFGAALRADSPVYVTAEATLDGAGAAAGGACPEAPVPGLVAVTGAATIEAGATVTGAPPIVERPAASVAAVAGIPFASLTALADHELAGVLTPRAGPCDGSDPSDWGDPSGLGPDCADHHPFIAAVGDLVLAGGSGQGVLLVGGRLHMTNGARFDGAVIAASLQLEDGTITGAVRTFGADSSRVRGTIRYDGCMLDRALRTRALRQPFRHGPRLWLPTR